MAKNRSMAIKHDKAKKYAMKEVMDNAKCEMCCKNIPKKISMIHGSYKTSRDDFFYSSFAIQKRVDVLAGRHYPIEAFKQDWHSIYIYLITHTVPEAREYFGNMISRI